MKKQICLRCKGNGYITIKKSIDHPINIASQCPLCSSQGEIMIDEQRLKDVLEKNLEIEKEKNLNFLKYIKNLEKEIDMLKKQKEYLQIKLKQKNQQEPLVLIQEVVNER